MKINIVINLHTSNKIKFIYKLCEKESCSKFGIKIALTRFICSFVPIVQMLDALIMLISIVVFV